jgi:hypothetical protein
MARVVAFVPDLLFGSQVIGVLEAAGHDAVLVSDPSRLEEEAPGAHVLVVDLTADAYERIDLVKAAELDGAKTLAFYSHVEADVRARAQAAGFTQVVPRSRMAREGAALVEKLAP